MDAKDWRKILVCGPDPYRDATWAALIAREMLRAKDTSDVTNCSMEPEVLMAEFDPGRVYGYAGPVQPWTLWTQERVYFPVGYDGHVWAGSAMLRPGAQGVGTPLQGGGCQTEDW